MQHVAMNVEDCVGLQVIHRIMTPLGPEAGENNQFKFVRGLSGIVSLFLCESSAQEEN
jgi:hypothetical protein